MSIKNYRIIKSQTFEDDLKNLVNYYKGKNKYYSDKFVLEILEKIDSLSYMSYRNSFFLNYYTNDDTVRCLILKKMYIVYVINEKNNEIVIKRLIHISQNKDAYRIIKEHEEIFYKDETMKNDKKIKVKIKVHEEIFNIVDNNTKRLALPVNVLVELFLNQVIMREKLPFVTTLPKSYIDIDKDLNLE